MLLALFSLKAQIGGLSASKLSAYNTETVNKSTAELEPNLDVFINYDSLHRESVTKFSALRFTYGQTNQLETGIYADLILNYVQMGVKYRFFEQTHNSLAFMGGLNLSTINKLKIDQLGLGLIYTHEFTENLSLDANLTYAATPNLKNYSLNFLTDIGCYFGYFQPIVELGYQFSPYQGNSLLSALGFTLESAKTFIIVLYLPYKYNFLNKSTQIGANLAITITLE